MLGGRRTSSDEHIQRKLLATAERSQRSHQLEVLEQHVTRVSAAAGECRAPQPESAGPVAPGDADSAMSAQYRARPAKGRVRSSSEVERPRHLEQGTHAFELTGLVANVVVREDDVFVARREHSGDDAADLAIERSGFGGEHSNDRSEPLSMGVDHMRGGSVDDEDLVDASRIRCK